MTEEYPQFKLFDYIPLYVANLSGDGEEGYYYIDKDTKMTPEALEDATLIQLMAASNSLGRGLGERKIKAILREYPDIMLWEKDTDEIINMIIKINGFSHKTAGQFALNLEKFKQFVKDIPCLDKFLTETYNDDIKGGGDNESPFAGKTIVFSGFRNAEWTKVIEAVGGKVSGNVSSNTDILVCKDPNSTTAKVTMAKSLDKQVMSIDEFSELM